MRSATIRPARATTVAETCGWGSTVTGAATTDRAGTCRPRSEPGVRRSPPVEGEGDVDRGRLGERVEQHEHVGGVEGRRARGEVPLVRGRGRARSGVDPVGPRTTCSTTISPPRNSTSADAYGADDQLDQLHPHLAPGRHLLAHRLGLALAGVRGDRSRWSGGPSGCRRSRSGWPRRPPRRCRRRSTRWTSSASSPAAVGIIRAAGAGRPRPARTPRRAAAPSVPWSTSRRDDEQGGDREQRRPAAGHAGLPSARPRPAGPPRFDWRAGAARRGPPHPDDRGQPEEDLERRAATAYQAGERWVSAGVAGVADGEPLRPSRRRSSARCRRRNPTSSRQPGDARSASRTAPPADRCAPPRWCGRCGRGRPATKTRDARRPRRP